MKLRDLFVSIGFDVDDTQLKALDKGLSQTKTLILAVGTAAAASAGLLVSMAKSVADTGDKAAKTADKLGVQIEALQELRYAAELSGVAQQNFDTALQRMTRRAAEAAKGTGEAKDALRQLNVQLTDGQGRMRRSEELLADIADGLAGIEDPSRRVALAFKLFDTEGVGMVNMLSKGGAHLRVMRAEARELGFVLSERTARDAEAFQDELLRSKSILAGIKNTVGAGLLPVFIELMQQFRQWVALNREIIKSGVEKTLRGAIVLLRWLYQTGRTVVGMLADIVELFGGIERVAKAAAWAVGIFAGAQILSAMGNLSLGLLQLTRVVRGFGNAALLANLKAAAIPVLIGAAVVALILLFQDLYSYVKGDKSVFGELMKRFESLNIWAKTFIRAVMPVFAFFELLFVSVETKFKAVKEMIAEVTSRLEKFNGLLMLIPGIGNVLAAYYTARQVIGGTPDSGTGMVNATAPKINQDVRVNAPITVNVPEGTSPEAVSNAVRRGISDGLQRLFNDTSLETAPKVDW